MSVPRVGVICSLVEEKWPSMDTVAQMLLKYLGEDHAETVTAIRLCPPMRRRVARLPIPAARAYNADRFLSRFWDYPRWVRLRRGDFDLFHIVDHSYGQLVHGLPADRTIITCHDLDAFRCILEPSSERRSTLFRAVVRHALSGFRRAGRVACVSVATRDQILSHGLIPPDRLVVVPNGVHPSSSPEPNAQADAEADRLLGPARGNGVEILHVGSVIPRKRIDVLLRVFASVRNESPAARLVRVGGPFTSPQTRLAEELKLGSSVAVLPFLERPVLAAVYRRAALVLQPSEREGFGLPVVEGLACGTPVVASDLPVLREVGGDAATYCPVNDLGAWTGAVIGLLRERALEPDRWSLRRAAGVARAAKFSWEEYAKTMVALYREILDD